MTSTSVQFTAVSINAESEATLEQQDIRANFAGLRADLVLVYPVESVDNLKVDAEVDAEPAKGCLKQMIQSMKGVKLKRSYKDEAAALENRLEGRARSAMGRRGGDYSGRGASMPDSAGGRTSERMVPDDNTLRDR